MTDFDFRNKAEPILEDLLRFLDDHWFCEDHESVGSSEELRDAAEDLLKDYRGRK